MSKAKDELQKKLIAETHAWIRDCGLDVQDIEVFIDREIMPIIDTYIKETIGENDGTTGHTNREILNHLASRNDLRTSIRDKAGL